METTDRKEGVTITLSNEKSIEFFHNALCNGLDYISGYGLSLDFVKAEYKNSSEKWRQEHPNETCCYEDVLIQMLRDGYSLTIVDEECDGEYTRTIRLGDVWERVSKTPQRFLFDMIEENDDAETADVILQTVFFEDIIFG
jgi:hypothetical protein